MVYPTLPTAIPELRITNDTTAKALSLSVLHIDVKVAANIASTTFDMVFDNPNDRILEGEFDFPLAEGQQVIRYALDIDGHLREGVVTEKAKARKAFESTIRRKVDPGLVEKTKGNNFRTRIYPLPAKGSRHIIIEVEEELQQGENNYVYQLPLYSAGPIADFKLKATVIKSAVAPVPESAESQTLYFQQTADAWTASFLEKNYKAGQLLRFSLPRSGKDKRIILTETADNKSWFYVNEFLEAAGQKTAAPERITLLWDVSGSAANRKLPEEKALLAAYIKSLGTATVNLIPFHITTGESRRFEIRDGNPGELLKAIDAFAYDGGTRLGAIVLPEGAADQVLLFTDGLATIGTNKIQSGGVPVTAISSAAGPDYGYLQSVVQQGGKLIDLQTHSTDEALAALQEDWLQVLGTVCNPEEISELVFPVGRDIGRGLSFAGRLLVPEARLTVKLGYGNTVTDTREYIISRSKKVDFDEVKRIWAGLRIRELEMQPEKNREEITTLGKTYSVVSSFTSLIVLDRVEDYVEHEIVPPVELQKEYYVQLSEKKKAESSRSKNTLEAALTSMQELKDWWKRDYSKYKAFKPDPVDSIIITTERQEGIADNGTVMMYSDSTGNMQQSFSYTSPQVMNDERVAAPAAGDMQEIRLSEMGKAEDDSKAENEKPEILTEKGIELKEWKPDVPYLKELEKTTVANREKLYFRLKNQYADQPSFFMDVARFFLEHKQQATALRIMSNIAELKLEDAVLLRMLAAQLQETGEKELAVELYRDILRIREEEPQSYRDLALALNESGEYKEAVALLYYSVLHSWDDRFTGMQPVLLNEMNAIINAHPDQVNIGNIDKRLIASLPVDVRIVISWNTDNTDMDLWVTDPRKEKCLYSHNQTLIGGHLSRDMTQGYGPEEFILKKAINGKYKVEVNLFGDSRQTIGGPVTIYAELFTDYGKPTQKRQTISFRVNSAKEVVEIGALAVGV